MTDRVYSKLVVLLLFVGSCTTAAGGPWPTKTGIAASTEDATVSANNPAAMTRFDSRSTRVGVYGFFSESTFEGTSSGTGTDFVSESDSTTIIPSGNMVFPFANNEWWFGFTVLGVGFSDDFGDWRGRYIIQDYSLAYLSAYPEYRDQAHRQIIGRRKPHAYLHGLRAKQGRIEPRPWIRRWRAKPRRGWMDSGMVAFNVV